MPYRSSLETDLKILKVLALEKEASQYDLPKHKDIKKNYRTILRHLKSLKDRGLIHLVRTEKSKKKGKEKNIWGITARGLVLALGSLDLWKHFDKIVNNNKDKFLIFQEWESFTLGEKEKIRDEFQLHFNPKSPAALQHTVLYTPDDEIKRVVNDLFLRWTSVSDEMYQITKKNPQLREYMIRVRHKDWENTQKQVERLKRQIADLESS